MTPGKQALFALTLILGETDERWALLIDQPEDDLDSRSIYWDIVRYLVEQKKQRQIILVTHNANLVVGADAEEVLVANRHGDDRKNKDGRTFDYLTGSLEHSEPKKSATYDLERMGIREHAVEILDGGEEAFQKRRDKYKI
jgi:predicted ATPase